MPPSSRPAALALFLLTACDEDEPVPAVPIDQLDGGLRDASWPDTSCRAETDLDCDGYTLDAGDCDDGDPARNPGAIDTPLNGLDEDCSGGDALASPMSCDAPLAARDTNAEAAAKALGLCGDEVTSISGHAGLIDADWLRVDGTRGNSALRSPLQVWLPERFGQIPAREGSRMLALSTGVARDVNDAQYTDRCDVFASPSDAGDGGLAWRGLAPPEGFPRDSSQCDELVTEGELAYDDVGLMLELRAPSNATTLAFDSMFFTYEYPDFVCSRFNDFFAVLMSPKPAGFADGNIVLDANQDPIGVNSALLSVCTPSDEARVGRAIPCALGPALLQDTGYGTDEARCAPVLGDLPNIGGAATGWLHTEVPVDPGRQFKLRFLLWDSGDPLLDSTVLLDNFQFLARPPTIGTRPITSP